MKLSKVIAYLKPICANCKHFTWSDELHDIHTDRGNCPKKKVQIDGKDKACQHFNA